MNAPRDVLAALYRARFGHDPERESPVAPQGSKRQMVRLSGPGIHSAIGVSGPDLDENRAFLSFSKSLRAADLPVPAILGQADDGLHYLVEDLGDQTLFQKLEAERAAHPGQAFPDSMRPIYEQVLTVLPQIQLRGHEVVDYCDAHPRAVFDRRAIKWDLDAFKYMFLRLAGIGYHEDRLEDDCNNLVEHLLSAGSNSFVFRDFQSRNIMLRNGSLRNGMLQEGGSPIETPWFIDYQGGRRGALQYDVASLLYDGKAAIPETVRAELLEVYLDAASDVGEIDRDQFKSHYGGYVLIRVLQAMSAYGYLGFYLRKPHFLQSVPHAVRSLETLLQREHLLHSLPELKRIFEVIVSSDRLRAAPVATPGSLTVRIGSFSYKHGYPVETEGHGGGYVFDCRAVLNPGRQAQYAGLCGLDVPVVEYLERLPEARAFYGHTTGLVRAQVETYRERGFTSLCVHFGCTGGQHRSVYFAQRLAAELRAAFPDIEVVAQHRETDRWPVTAGRDTRSSTVDSSIGE